MDREMEYVDGCKSVVAFEAGGERREVFLGTRSEGVCILEMSCGPLTESVFGAGTRQHEVWVGREDVTRLGWLLGSGGTCAGEEDLVDALRSFFGEGECFLSDLMDEMDGAGVRYAYVSCIPGEGVWYRPVRDATDCVA